MNIKPVGPNPEQQMTCGDCGKMMNSRSVQVYKDVDRDEQERRGIMCTACVVKIPVNERNPKVGKGKTKMGDMNYQPLDI